MATTVNKLNILDDFLPRNEFENIKQIMLSNNFPWFLNDGKTDHLNPTESLVDYQFNHLFYENGLANSDYYYLLSPILRAIHPLALVRIKANLNPYINSIEHYPHHTDYDNEKITTGIFYLTTTDAPTEFQDGTKCQCVENRFVSFNALQAHRGTLLTNKKFRCLINFNYIKE